MTVEWSLVWFLACAGLCAAAGMGAWAWRRERLAREQLLAERRGLQDTLDRARKAVAAYEQEFNAVADHAPLALLMVQREVLVYANAQTDAMFGWRERLSVGRHPQDFYLSPEHYQDVQQRVWPTLSLGRAVTFETELGGQMDSRRFAARVYAKPIVEADGTVFTSVWIIQDVTAERRLERERMEALERAEAATRAKSAFLANISHEIRTPLNALVNLHEIVLRTRLTHEQRELMHKARTANQSLLALVNDVLDFSKIEADALMLEEAPFHLDAVLDEVETLMRAQPRKPEVDLRVLRGHTSGLRLLGDATRLRQVLINLGNNALKFTERGEVVLAVDCRPDGADEGRPRWAVHAAVSDTGIGMDAQVVHDLFKPFTQADASVNRRFGGTGLGLAISGQIVRTMGSSIQVSSRPGAGSRFEFTVRLEEAPAAEETDPLSEEAASAHSSPATRGTRKLAGLNILVVDDNALNRFVVKRILSDEGAVVSEACDGRAALDLLESSATDLPDLIFMDLQMPVMDGLTATGLIKGRPAWADIPVVALSGDVTVQQRDAAMAAGVLRFLAKPITLDRLMGCIASLGLMAVVQGRRAQAQAGALQAGSPGAQLPLLGVHDPELIGLGLQEIDLALQRLAPLGPGDRAALRQVAHRIRGTALDLQMVELSEAAQALEEAARRDGARAPALDDPMGRFQQALLAGRTALAGAQLKSARAG